MKVEHRGHCLDVFLVEKGLPTIHLQAKGSSQAAGVLKYSKAKERVMWGRSYYLEVRRAGDIASRPGEDGDLKL